MEGEQRRKNGGGEGYLYRGTGNKQDAAHSTRLWKLLRSFFCFISVFVFFWESFEFGALAMGFGIFFGLGEAL